MVHQHGNRYTVFEFLLRLLFSFSSKALEKGMNPLVPVLEIFKLTSNFLNRSRNKIWRQNSFFGTESKRQICAEKCQLLLIQLLVFLLCIYLTSFSTTQENKYCTPSKNRIHGKIVRNFTLYRMLVKIIYSIWVLN